MLAYVPFVDATNTWAPVTLTDILLFSLFKFTYGNPKSMGKNLY